MNHNEFSLIGKSLGVYATRKGKSYKPEDIGEHYADRKGTNPYLDRIRDAFFGKLK